MAATGVLDSTPGYTHPADAEPSLSDRLDDRGELPPDPRQRWDMVPHGKPYVAGETQPISTERYTVGWIAALPLERAAAEQILDSIHPKPTDFSKTPNDHNTYTFGQIGEHYIVITSLEVGIYGTNSAATTAQWMLSSFPQIRFGLLVGIGAGLPSEDADIRLGDVAVSQPDGATGGVVQYDLVKATSDGPRRKGSLNKPPAVLLSALGKLQAKHKSKEYGIPTILEEWKQRNPAMFESEPGDPGYEFQGVENDRLFDEQYQHQKGKNCKKCDPSKILSRDPPVRKDAERPRIHYGVIASGNALVKDAGWRSKLLEHIDEECICYEMEAAGLMNNFPCLVIRGICDYADSHKNDQWQPYAAGTAAAFAKELLQLVEVDGLVSTPRAKDLMDKLNEVSHSLENVESVTTSIRVDLDDKELRKWLSPSDPWTSYEQNIKERHGESGSWFIGGQPFSKWKREPQSFLWLHGSPGCGKTVLSSAIIKDLTTPKNTAPTKTLFFFFDFRNAKSTTEQMLRSLTFQYSQGNNLYQAYLHQQRSTEQAGGKRDSWETMLQTAVSQAQGDLNIVLDALDECKDRKTLLKLLENIYDKSARNRERRLLHVLVTSRSEEDIRSSLMKHLDDKHSVKLEKRLVAKDIRAFVHDQIRTDPGFEHWKKDEEAFEEIEETLTMKAGGMFRWAACQLDALQGCYHRPALREALQSLPADLTATYDRILQDLSSRHRNDAIRILQFLAFDSSVRRLSLDEVNDILAVDLQASPPHFNPSNRMPEPKHIILICSSLIKATERPRSKKTYLSLAHLSVKEYLTSDLIAQGFRSEFQNIFARSILVEIKLAYVLSVIERERENILHWKEIRLKYPFLCRAGGSWKVDAALAEENSSAVRGSTYTLFSTGLYMNLHLCILADHPSLISDDTEESDKHPLYHASRLGLLHTVIALLGDMMEKDSSEKERYIAITTSALESGSRREASVSALCVAIERHHDKVFNALINTPSVFSPKIELNFALHTAVRLGDDAAATALLEKYKDLDLDTNTALDIGSNMGHGSTVRLLLKHGASPQSTTALSRAASRGHETVVKLLLQHGAEVIPQVPAGGFIYDALEAAATGGHTNIVKALLMKGTNSHTMDGSYDRALVAACCQRGTDTIRILIEHGADVNLKKRFHVTALDYALTSGKSIVEKVQLLLENGAELGHDTATRLVFGIYRDTLAFQKIAQTLGRRGVNGPREQARLLSSAALQRNEPYVKTLLDMQVDVNLEAGEEDRLPLNAACLIGSESIVRMLLDAGAQINARSGKFGSALYVASYHGYESIVRILIDRGADVNAHGGEFGHPLHAALQRGHTEIASLLKEHGSIY